jgi:uncharacterized OB-fold protein
MRVKGRRMSELREVGRYNGPALVVHPESEPFWRELGAGRLRLQQCRGCTTKRFPIAPVCWSCGSLEYDWAGISTAGTISAAVTVRRATGDQVWAAEVPYIIAQVDMEGALRLPGRVICDPAADVSHGTPVRAAFLAADDDYGVLCFVLDELP